MAMVFIHEGDMLLVYDLYCSIVTKQKGMMLS